MPQVDFSNFFSTLPPTVSFPLKRKAKKPSALCWFNPNRLEDALPDFEEVIGEHWDITNEDFPVFTEEEEIDELCELLSDFCLPSSENLFIDEPVLITINKNKASAELCYRLQSESQELTCVDVIQESEFLGRVRSLYLLSKAISDSIDDPNTFGGDSLYPSPEGQLVPWRTEFIQAKDLLDAQKKVSAFLTTHNPRYRTWAVLMEIIGKKLHTAVYLLARVQKCPT